MPEEAIVARLIIEPVTVGKYRAWDEVHVLGRYVIVRHGNDIGTFTVWGQSSVRSSLRAITLQHGSG